MAESRVWREAVGTTRLYNEAFTDRDDVVLWDVFPVRDGEMLRLVFESRAGRGEQGVRLACDGGVVGEGWSGEAVRLWWGHSPMVVEFQCHTSNGLLSVYNIWDFGQGVQSQMHSSGMLVEEIPGGRRYRCNDVGFDTQFEKVVFRIERVSALERA